MFLFDFSFSFRYSLEGTIYFSIDELSGMISTKLELDRENLERHEFRVLARDSSEFQPLTGTATVTVRVTDVDDNRPVFEVSGSNDFFIPNGVKEGDFILGVSGKSDNFNQHLIQYCYTSSVLASTKLNYFLNINSLGFGLECARKQDNPVFRTSSLCLFHVNRISINGLILN